MFAQVLVWCGASFARRPAFAQYCARESNSERELAQVESTVCFQRKLSSERVTRASVPSLLARPVLRSALM